MVARDCLELSVIIVSYNTREMTVDCLRALYSDLDTTPSEVWLVDNGSTDGSAAAVRDAFPQVKVIPNRRNRGFGAANNSALRLAGGKFLLLLNSDAFPRKGAVPALLSRMRDEPEVAVLGPRLLTKDGSLQPSCYKFPGPGRAVCEHLLLTAAFPNHPVLGDYRAWPHDRPREVDFVIGACMLVRREAVEKVGPFDEGFFLYGEEADWCFRFRKAGWKIQFWPDAEVVHLGGGSGADQPGRVFCEFRRAQERFISKHHGVLGLMAFRFMLVVGSCLRIVAFGCAAAIAPKRRPARLRLTRLWLRILVWNIGFRGPGLAGH